MRRAERKLQLSHNIVGDDVEEQESKDSAGVEASDLRSVIFGLGIFDPTEMNEKDSDEVKISKLNAMSEKVIAMRCEQVEGKDDRKFEVTQTDMLRETSTFNFDAGFDEASYLSWVEKFKEASQTSGDQFIDIRRRELDEDKCAKLEAAKKKAENRKLLKWEALGYHSLSINDPVGPSDSDALSELGSVQFVYGDCTKPSDVCPSEPAIIFRSESQARTSHECSFTFSLVRLKL